MKKLLLLLFFLPTTSFAAIAFDNSGIDGGSGNNPHTFSTSMTATSTNNIIVVNVEVNSAGDTNSCTGGTINGVTLTPTTARQFISGIGTLWVYYAMNVGGTVTINMNGCTAGQTNVSYQSYTGVDSTSPINASTTNSVSGTSITTSITTLVDNSWTTAFVMNSTASGFVASTGVTSRGIYFSGFLGTGDSGSAITPAGAYSMKWTGPSATWKTIELALSPQASTATGIKKTFYGRKLFMRNGKL